MKEKRLNLNTLIRKDSLNKTINYISEPYNDDDDEDDDDDDLGRSILN